MCIFIWMGRTNREVKKSLLLQRAGNPDEVVGAALYLASDASSYSTGGVINLTGGFA